MFGKFTGRGRQAALDELRDLLRDVGPAEYALKELRSAHNLTQHELASAAGVSQGQISGLESGAKELTPATAGQIAGALGVDPEALLAAVKLGRLRQALEGGNSSQPLTMQILTLLEIVDRYVPDGELQTDLKALLTESLGAAVERDRTRLKALAEEKAQDGKAPTKVATKSAGRGPDRDAHGRRIHKAGTPQGERGVAMKARKKPKVRRDAFGKNKANRRRADMGR